MEDTLTLTLRLHDPKEKLDAEKSASWAIVQVARGDLASGEDEFIARYITPALRQLKQLALK